MAIDGVSGVRADISTMLQKIRDASSKQPALSTGAVQAKPESNFSAIMDNMKTELSAVNEAQSSAESLKSAYMTGDSSVSIAQVVVAAEKSKLAFEGLVVVRNKLLDAYKEIMNMPV